MIQFNLLPDIKIEYIRAKRVKRTVITAAFIIIGGSLAVVGILAGTVYGFQKNHINNLGEDIAKIEQEIQSVEQIDRVLTVQNQLTTIDGLHQDKPVASRLFTYIERLTPTDVSINKIEVDFDLSTIVVSGQSPDLASVNKFVDTLKFTEFSVNDIDESSVTDDTSASVSSLGRAFSGVVLSSFSASASETTYTVELDFDPAIFDSESEALLILQNKISTRSELEKPTDLFQNPREEGTE